MLIAGHPVSDARVGRCNAARTLRSDASLRSARLIALTGYAQPEDCARAMEAGFDAHLAKPASIDELQDLIAGR